MAGIIPNEAKDTWLQLILGKDTAEDLTIKLYVNNFTPDADTVIGDFTEATGGGYSDIDLTGSSWTVASSDNKAQATYAQQTFSFSGALTTNTTVYGIYYVMSSSGNLVAAVPLANPYTPSASNNEIAFTPTLQAFVQTSGDIDIPNAAEVKMLEKVVNKVAAQNLSLGLFTNDLTIGNSTVAGDFTEASGGGYSAKTLTAASWSMSEVSDEAVATYAQQTFTFTGALSGSATVYGEFYTEVTSGDLIYARKYTGDEQFTPAANGETIKTTPRIEAGAG